MFFNEGIIKEAYFGKTPGILALEKQLDIFRQKHMGHYMIPCNSDPELLKFNRMMEKQFGFGCFSLQVVNQPVMNAYTMPIDYRFNIRTVANSKPVIYDHKEGYKFNPALEYACIECIYSGVIFNPHFTTPEVMAILLHETGHNFYSRMRSGNGILSAVYKPLYLYMAIMNTIIHLNPMEIAQFSNTVLWFDRKIDQILRNNDIGKIIYFCLFDLPTWVRDVIVTGIGVIFKIANYLSFNTLTLMSGLISSYRKLSNPFTYILLPRQLTDEKSADNFAALYGYGPELASGLDKLGNKKNEPSEIDNALNQIPVIAPLYHLVAFPAEFLLTSVDEHSAVITRAQDQLDMLKREANKSDIDPKMRKVILADCAAIEKEIDQITKVSNDMDDPILFKRIWYKTLYDQYGTKRFKDMLYDSFHHDVNAEYDEKFN